MTTATTYQLSSPDQQFGFQYGRYENPTRNGLDKSLAALDNAEYALSFSAGVGALTAIIATLQSGDGIISTTNLYGGTIRLFRDFAAKMGIETDYVDFDDLEGFERALKPNTKLVWIETPTNPLLTVLDVRAIADIVHSKSEAKLIVDNTFLTSYFQRPLELGADIVMYSLSKFTNGHSDVIMGAITTNDKELYENLKYYQVSTGVTPGPYDCFIVQRSLKTLALRMERHSENSYAAAKFLEAHPKVEKVFHPSLKSHPKHEIALSQSYGHSGIMSFYLKASEEGTKRFFKSLKFILVAQSLGGVESSMSYPFAMSHSDLPEKQRIEAGVTSNLVRFSVGIEDITGLIADIEQALEQV